MDRLRFLFRNGKHLRVVYLLVQQCILQHLLHILHIMEVQSLHIFRFNFTDILLILLAEDDVGNPCTFCSQGSFRGSRPPAVLFPGG